MIAASRTSHTKLWHWKLTGNGYKGKMPLNNVKCFLISPVFFCYMRRCLDASCTGKGRGMRQPGGVAGRSKPGSCFTWGLPLLRMAVGSWGGSQSHGGEGRRVRNLLTSTAGAGLALSREVEALTEDKTDTETSHHL